MSGRPVTGTEGYSVEAPELLKLYENISFEDAHGGVLDLIPPPPIAVLDIGAGTGRDAAWFAKRGDRVTAIEPTREMREGATALHPNSKIEWINDCLPELASVRGRTFDLVWMSAVWMHFLASERAAMMLVVAALLGSRASLMISLRHGPLREGRRMFEVSADETVAHAAGAGLENVRAGEFPSERLPDVTWSRLWFRKAG
ncbi:MAG: class I SAM-dependent methyltransferase [Caulobacteraceae bacterium]